MAYFRLQPSTLLQNFIYLRQSAAELLMFVQKFKMAAAAILNYHFVMLDHPQSPFVHLKFSFKFRVSRVCTFRDISQIWLKMHAYLGPQNHVFLLSFDPQTLFFIIETSKNNYLTRKHAF